MDDDKLFKRIVVLKTSLSKKNGAQGLPGFLVSHLMISKRGDSLASESPLQTTYWNINLENLMNASGWYMDVSPKNSGTFSHPNHPF